MNATVRNIQWFGYSTMRDHHIGAKGPFTDNFYAHDIDNVVEAFLFEGLFISLEVVL